MSAWSRLTTWWVDRRSDSEWVLSPSALAVRVPGPEEGHGLATPDPEGTEGRSPVPTLWTTPDTPTDSQWSSQRLVSTTRRNTAFVRCAT